MDDVHEPGTPYRVSLTSKAAAHLQAAQDSYVPENQTPSALLGIGFAVLALEHAISSAVAQLAAALAGPPDHPPVPEQAAGPAQVQVIEDNADLWAGWQPGSWPVHDPLDPRGYRWADPLAGP